MFSLVDLFYDMALWLVLKVFVPKFKPLQLYFASISKFLKLIKPPVVLRSEGARIFKDVIELLPLESRDILVENYAKPVLHM